MSAPKFTGKVIDGRIEWYGNQKVYLNNWIATLEGEDDNGDPLTLNSSVFFNGIDFRSPNLLPPIENGSVTGFFPDPSFKGIIGPEGNLNEDIHNASGEQIPDGIPDVLQ